MAKAATVDQNTSAINPDDLAIPDDPGFQEEDGAFLPPSSDNPFADDLSLPPSFGAGSGDPFGSPSDEFEVDVSGVESREAMPQGAYIAELVSITKESSKAGNAMWVWEYKIVQGDFKDRTIKNFTALTPQALWKVTEAFAAHGIPTDNGKAKFKREDVIGTIVVLNVALGQYEGRPSNNIATIVAHPKGAGLRLKPTNVP